MKSIKLLITTLVLSLAVVTLLAVSCSGGNSKKNSSPAMLPTKK